MAHICPNLEKYSIFFSSALSKSIRFRNMTCTALWNFFFFFLRKNICKYKIWLCIIRIFSYWSSSKTKYSSFIESLTVEKNVTPCLFYHSLALTLAVTTTLNIASTYTDSLQIHTLNSKHTTAGNPTSSSTVISVDYRLFLASSLCSFLISTSLLNWINSVCLSMHTDIYLSALTQ